MKFTLLVVGRTLQKHFLRGVSDYTERIKHYIPFETEIIPEPKSAKHLHEDQQKEKEGNSILKVLRQGDVPILLDERGKEIRSVEFAAWIYPPTAFSFVATIILLVSDIALNYRIDIMPSNPRCTIAHKAII